MNPADRIMHKPPKAKTLVILSLYALIHEQILNRGTLGTKILSVNRDNLYPTDHGTGE
jgi:hypothetical protein